MPTIQDEIETRTPQDKQFQQSNSLPQQDSQKSSVQTQNLFKRMINLLKNNKFKTITLLLLSWAIALQIQIGIAHQIMNKNQSMKKKIYFDFMKEEKDTQVYLENKVYNNEQSIKSVEFDLNHINKQVDINNNSLIDSYFFKVEDEQNFTMQTQNQIMTTFPQSIEISILFKSFVTLDFYGQMLSKDSGFVFTFMKDKILIEEYISYNLNLNYFQTLKSDEYQVIKNYQEVVLEPGVHLFNIAYRPVYKTNYIEYSVKNLRFNVKVQVLYF